MNKNDINIEAKKIINTIFKPLLENDNKDDWQKWIDFILNKITKLEEWERGEELFIWRWVRNKISYLYWKKFIKNNNII